VTAGGIKPVRKQIPLSAMPQATPSTILSDCRFLRAVLQASLLRSLRDYLFSRQILIVVLKFFAVQWGKLTRFRVLDCLL
jgi:hypothetical protein